MKNAHLFALILNLLLALPALSDDVSSDLEELGDDFVVSTDGSVTVQQSNEGRGLGESYVSFSAAWKEKIKAVITAQLAQAIDAEQISFKQGFDWRNFVSQAYIEIREINDMPVAVIVGKQPIQFGQNLEMMPFFQNAPVKALQQLEQVFGLTIELTKGPLGFFDEIRASFYETQAEDMSIGKVNGKNLTLTKYLSERLLLTVGLTEEERTENDETYRANIGIVGTNKSGKLIGWLEGIIFHNDPNFQNSFVAVTGGLSWEFLPTATVVTEFSMINNYVYQLGLALKKDFPDLFYVGAEARISHLVQENTQDVFIGISLGTNFNYSSQDDDVKENLVDLDTLE